MAYCHGVRYRSIRFGRRSMPGRMQVNCIDSNCQTTGVVVNFGAAIAHGIHETDTTKNRQTNVHKQKVSRSELPKCGIHPRSSARETSLCSNPGLETWKPKRQRKKQKETETGTQRQTDRLQEQKVSRGVLRVWGLKGLGS